jgi:hypothetical protein
MAQADRALARRAARRGGGSPGTRGPMGTDDKIRTFEQSIVLPALAEVCASPALQRDFAAEVVVERPHADAPSEELLATLAATFRKRTGPSLLLANLEPPPDVIAIGGKYAMTVLYDLQGDDVHAAPGVMFWMKFDNKLHAFAHRYDNAIARHAVERITKLHVQNHVLNSLTFYKLHAFAPTAFPGYR